MSQSDIIEVLEKVHKPLSRKEIAEYLKCDSAIASHSLQRLVKSRSVKVIEINRETAMHKYNCKRRMRLYYL